MDERCEEDNAEYDRCNNFFDYLMMPMVMIIKEENNAEYDRCNNFLTIQS